MSDLDLERYFTEMLDRFSLHVAVVFPYGTILAGVLSAYSNYRKWRKIIHVPTLVVEKLIIYPVRLLPGIEIDSCEVKMYGIKYNEMRDR